MTTAIARRDQAKEASSTLLPGLLLLGEPPAALVESRQIPGFRNPQWVVRALEPNEHIAVQHALIAFEERLKPAADERVIYHVARLLAHWSAKKGHDQDSIIDDFANDLAAYSEPHVVEACAQWRRSSKHRPVPADLVAVLDQLRHREELLRRRARVLIGLEDPKPWERVDTVADGPFLTPDEKAALRRKLLGENNTQGST